MQHVWRRLGMNEMVATRCSVVVHPPHACKALVNHRRTAVAFQRIVAVVRPVAGTRRRCAVIGVPRRCYKQIAGGVGTRPGGKGSNKNKL